MKTKIIPFDFTRINENGLIIETKCGLKVSVLCTNAKGKFPIVVLIDNGTFESCIQYDKSGTPKAAWEDLKLIMRVHTDCGQRKPKFQKGDWVIDKEGRVQQITDVRKNIYKPIYEYSTISYSLGILSYSCFNENVEGIRLWDIKDAKPGDVLVCIGKYGQEIGIVKKYVGKYGGCDKCFEMYCFVDWEGIFRLGEYMGSKETYPATKEQCGILFQKMKEAGYEWNSDKKELHKIEEAKTRKMTNQELSDWLRDCPEEHREYTYADSSIIRNNFAYCDEDASKSADDILVRRNHGEWQKPLIDIK